MFKKILVANRGEIACRVMSTAKRMGIKTVAVYSEADRGAVHVDMADEAVCIGPAPSAESYLVQKNILKAIADTGADAVHPGYGFLSENASFARALARAGIAFIGPKPHAITAMGDKIESKKLAAKAGVNTIPGHTEAVKDARQAVSIAKKIGYPVMIKASAGGGGKGMRVAWDDAGCKEGFERATSEARSSFGDDRVFIEKFIEEPRHIEIQVLGDSHGNVVYLWERECSIQRRHQKVIEEAPSPFLDDETRRAMGEQAVSLAKAVKYQSAGTVEFIVDKNKNFYFLEMNTRLQVEHPVTELITGLDLVEQMIRVAAGEKLAFGQSDIKRDGWAMESRIYAEDPFRNFLPSIGRLVRYVPPGADLADDGAVIRVDTGVEKGGEISMYYDPMIAKLVTWGRDREHAVETMQSALDAFYIRGVSHNIAFVAALMAHKRFRAGNLTTNFIAEEYPDGFNPADVPSDNAEVMIAAAAAVHMAYQLRAAEIGGQTKGYERIVDHDWVVITGDDEHAAEVRPVDGGYDVRLAGGLVPIRTRWQVGEAIMPVSVNGQRLCLQVERIGIGYRLTHGGAQRDIYVMNPTNAALARHMPVKAAPDTSKLLMSPMPGLLVSVAVTEGQEVKAGEELAVIEAMKMENVMRAERDGVVSSIKAAPGDSLMVDQVIMEFS
ncbi:MAG: acetyl/propionyl/methylcrotonyl-CoA carboxylase subunit alpha [Rhodospirillales bacterium]